MPSMKEVTWVMRKYERLVLIDKQEAAYSTDMTPSLCFSPPQMRSLLPSISSHRIFHDIPSELQSTRRSRFE